MDWYSAMPHLPLPFRPRISSVASSPKACTTSYCFSCQEKTVLPAAAGVQKSTFNKLSPRLHAQCIGLENVMLWLSSMVVLKIIMPWSPQNRLTPNEGSHTWYRHKHALKLASDLPPYCNSMQEDSSKRCSLYMQYALLAAQEALLDAGWHDPRSQMSPEQRMSVGVTIGSGMSSCSEVIEAWHLLVGLFDST